MSAVRLTRDDVMCEEISLYIETLIRTSAARDPGGDDAVDTDNLTRNNGNEDTAKTKFKGERKGKTHMRCLTT